MRVALVVACTNGKTRRPVVRLGDESGRHRTRGGADRFWTWAERVEQHDSGRLQAVDLYSGVAWSATLDASQALGEAAETDLWIMSAGYGLVHAQAQLVPYSATFSPGKRDSVARTANRDWVESNRAWWSRLTEWVPSGFDRPRSLTALAERVDGLAFVMSPRYLEAGGTDVLAAVEGVRSAVIVSGGLSDTSPLAPYALPFDKRLREGADVTGEPRLVRASDMSLNQRVAEHLFRVLGAEVFDRSEARQYLREQVDRREPARTFAHRSAATDEEVLDWIVEQLMEDRSASKSRLLRDWRASDRKCEQKRFGRLFTEAQSVVELADMTPRQSELAL